MVGLSRVSALVNVLKLTKVRTKIGYWKSYPRKVEDFSGLLSLRYGVGENHSNILFSGQALFQNGF